MMTAAFVGLLFGALLGLVVRMFRLSALAAPSVAILLATFLYGLYQDYAVWQIVLTMALNVIALQLGYLGVLVVEFMKSPENRAQSSDLSNEKHPVEKARPLSTSFRRL